MATPKLDRAKAVRVLIDAARLGDRKACEAHKITDRTLRNYRTRFESDPELAEAFRIKNAVEDRSWKAARRAALASGILKLEELIAMALPDQIRDVANAVKVLGELEITQEALAGPSADQPSEVPGETSRGSGQVTPGGQSPQQRPVH